MIKSESNLDEDLKGYTKIQRIGEGTYGVVYKAKDKKTDEPIAIKKVKFEDESDGIPSTSMREISVLKKLKHPNIVNLKDLIQSNNRLYMCFEYLDYDLKKFLELHRNPLPENIVKPYIYQLLLAIEYCHRQSILHRDLKPQNLLIDKKGTLKVADFGLARFFTVPLRVLTHEILTLWYRAPEILLGQEIYSSPIDIWSIGCIFYELAHEGEVFFKGDSEIDQIFKIFKKLGTPNNSTWKKVEMLPNYSKHFPRFKVEPLKTFCKNFNRKALDLFNKLMQLDPANRINAIDALNHPYFDDLEKSEFFQPEDY